MANNPKKIVENVGAVAINDKKMIHTFRVFSTSAQKVENFESFVNFRNS